MLEHLAIIMDGNGRWAKKRGLPRLKGHEAGAETVRRVLKLCRKYGVKYLTLYAFSTENWSRPAAEVSGLMLLLKRFLHDNLRELHENDVRMRVIGRRSDLPKDVQKVVADAEAETIDHKSGQLLIALSYGGRAELADAARSLARDVAAGKVDPETVDESALASRLYAPDVPDPDMIVRTSGELRLSNFLLWEAAYSELFVTPVLWPDFGEEDFKAVLDAFAQRDRRYGGLSKSPADPATPSAK